MPRSERTWRWLAVAALLLTSACARHRDPTLARAGQDATSTSTTEIATTTVPATATSAPATTRPKAPPTTAAPLPGLGLGAKGPEVLALEQRLDALHYDPGPVDGKFDGNTAYAVTAFQKVTGMSRTGRATDDVVAALQTATDPPPVVAGGGATRVEIDLPRQVLFLYQGNALTKILPVSTGSGQRYCVDGACDRAVTPGGSFRVSRRIRGWHTSRLGRLYNPLFFNGGIAIHGSLSVPPRPASHGCVRIPMRAAEWFPQAVPNGTPVYVAGGPNAPVPFNEPAPGDTTSTIAPPPPPPSQPPPPPEDTTTTVPETTTTTTPLVP